MRVNSISTTFQGASNLSRLAQKAEKRLQKRLVSTNSLIYDTLTDTYYMSSSGKPFTGKFGISTDALEQFFHVKNGKLYATLVRGKDGSKKVGGFSLARKKLWPGAVGPLSFEEKMQLSKLSNAKDKAYMTMGHNFGIKKCIENGTDTFIASRGY